MKTTGHGRIKGNYNDTINHDTTDLTRTVSIQFDCREVNVLRIKQANNFSYTPRMPSFIFLIYCIVKHLFVKLFVFIVKQFQMTN